MPNWCSNSIAIQGPKNKIVDLWTQATIKEGLLAALVPQPEDMFHGNLGEAERAECAEKGIPNWYDWQVANWGTKWDVSLEGLEFTDHGDGTAEISGWFESAWAPPLEAFDTFLENNEDCYITASYHEGGMDFGGFYDNGIVEQCDDCYAQSKLPHDEQDDVFKRLDDEYDLSASYEMWDEDEEEDLTDLSPTM